MDSLWIHHTATARYREVAPRWGRVNPDLHAEIDCLLRQDEIGARALARVGRMLVTLGERIQTAASPGSCLGCGAPRQSLVLSPVSARLGGRARRTP